MTDTESALDTVDDALDAVDDAIDLMTDALGIATHGPYGDLVELVRNAIHTRFANLAASFGDVVEAHYVRTPEEIRGDWDNWSSPW